ncbi:hypothetical protein OG279_37045 (plasmid) [Streptomyces sp. NBC_01201]|uniref:hypothetical protein n=1 Tax=Streptomyces sp. NBC_01201 TaxID=2903770 RepID=UPI002E10008B|nr:hypothetical protein OG279_37045 [Streptomyces sp. NBC_01201]
MNQPRVIRVMADYESYPLWIPAEFDNIAPESQELALTPGLVKELNNWSDEFDATLRLEDPASSAFPTPAAERKFAEIGEHLARKLAQELGSNWQVLYFDPRTNENRKIS